MTKKDREEYLNDAQKRIDGYVRKFANSRKNRKPILDGITDVNSYLNSKNSKLKICWVLKEPYDEYNGKGGGFDLRKSHIKYLKVKDHNFGKTWTPVGYISYSLLNGFKSYNELQELDRNTVMKSLLNISFLNVGKMPAKFVTSSPYKVVAKLYNEWAPILNYQLITYDPNVIIFGNTLEHFWHDLKLEDKDFHESKNGNYCLKNNKILLDVYHPAVRGNTISQEDYCNGIINSVKKVFNNKV